GKKHHVMYRQGDDGGREWALVHDDEFADKSKTHKRLYTAKPPMGRNITPDKKTEARLKPPAAAPAPEAPPEYTVMRKPYAHQSQCSRCGYEGRVYEYGHDYPGKGIQWMPG